MKVFLDTEFYEFEPVGDWWDGQPPPLPGSNAVQLISIGAVREDGAEFYAENALFDWGNVPEDHWLQENVRPHLTAGPPAALLREWSMLGNHHVTGGFWNPVRIAGEFYRFAIGGEPTVETSDGGIIMEYSYSVPEFWGYFCDYDWVVLCGLYGRMVDLPPEFPMFCRDLKQEMARMDVKRVDLPTQPDDAHHALADARWIRDAYNFLPGDEMSKSDLHE